MKLSRTLRLPQHKWNIYWLLMWYRILLGIASAQLIRWFLFSLRSPQSAWYAQVDITFVVLSPFPDHVFDLHTMTTTTATTTDEVHTGPHVFTVTLWLSWLRLSEPDSRFERMGQHEFTGGVGGIWLSWRSKLVSKILDSGASSQAGTRIVCDNCLDQLAAAPPPATKLCEVVRPVSVCW